MYLSVSQFDVKNGFLIEGLGRKVFSFEGFCHFLYCYPDEFMEIISEGIYLDWMIKALKLEQAAASLANLYETPHTTLAKMKAVLDLCSYTRHKDITPFEEKYQAYVDAPTHRRYKSTGNKHFARADYSGAMSWYKSAQAIAFTADVANNMAVIHMYRNEFDKAAALLEKAIRHEDRLDIRLNRLRLMIIMKTFEKALAYLEETRKLYEDWQLWYYYGVVYEGLDMKEEALTAYMHSYDVSKTMTAYEAIIRLEIGMRLFDQALRHITHEVMDTGNRDLMYACLCRAKNQWTEYEMHMEKAIEAAENKTDLLLEISEHYRRQNQVIRAIEYVGRIDEKDQHREDVVMSKAIIAELAGNLMEYEHQIEGLLRDWKMEVRQAASR